MSKKKKKKKNPAIENARHVGIKEGMDLGQAKAIAFFADKFDGLDKVPGIGPKTYERIVNHFGPEYFVKVVIKK